MDYQSCEIYENI